jgi:hypothetical protein
MRTTFLKPLLALCLPAVLSTACSDDSKTDYKGILIESSWRIKNDAFIVNGDTIVQGVDNYDADDIFLYLETGVYLQTYNTLKRSSATQFRALWDISSDGKMLTITAIDSGKIAPMVYDVQELTSSSMILSAQTEMDIMAADSSFQTYEGKRVWWYVRK